MKVLLLRGNPRKSGFTQQLTDLFLQGLRESNASVTDVHLPSLDLSPCVGCFHCWLTTPGQCIRDDKAREQLKLLLDADLIVCATPVYYFSMSSYLKVYFERTFPLATPGLHASQGGFSRNGIRYPERWKGKKLITIVVGALREIEVYRPINETFKLIADTLDLELVGQLTRPESYLLDFPFSKPKTLKRIKAAFVEAGREAGTAGRLSPETTATASLPLGVDSHYFREYSNIFWDNARELGDSDVTFSEIQKRANGDARILMREMIRFADPKALARVKAILQFEFPDRGLTFHIKIVLGKVELCEGTVAKPDLLVRCNTAVWAGIFIRQISVRDALSSGELVVQGDKSLFSRLDRFFPPASV